MASTDTRSGFRLPWSSDRSHDEAAEGPSTEAKEATEDASAPAAEDNGLGWPETDLHARLGIGGDEPRQLDDEPRQPEPEAEDGPRAEEPLMVDVNPAASAPAATPRKPSKLMADLSAAIRSTAETARDQSLAQTDTDARQVVEAIREQSTQGATALRQQSDEDIAGIREWSKAEIARIREETDEKITARKATLEQELSDHAASVEHRVEDVQAEVARYQADMEAYLERLRSEDDPARLATLAESMPDAPTFDAWITRDTDEATPEAEPAETEPAAEAETMVGDPEAATDEQGETEVDAMAEAEVAEGEAEVAEGEAEVAVGEVETATDADTTAEDADGDAESTAGSGEVDTAGLDETIGNADTAAEADDGDAADPASAESPNGGIAWGETSGDWSTPAARDDAQGGDEVGADVPRWAAGETPEGFPSGDESGEPVDRGAIMAALEAAAEAVVAAESASDSAEEAEAAANVAEMAAELFRGQASNSEVEGEGETATEVAVDDGTFETESFAGRLASLLPGHGGDADGEPQTSRVIVSGLVSVASIASFKRHLGRVPGVQGVSVSSGPDGEFVFSVTHRPDVVLRDVIPTLQGFAARVTSAEEGTVQVTARDPETES